MPPSHFGLAANSQPRAQASLGCAPLVGVQVSRCFSDTSTPMPGVPLEFSGSPGSHQNGFITMSARPGWLGRSRGPGIGSFERQGKLSRSRRKKLSSITDGIGTPSTSTTPA